MRIIMENTNAVSFAVVFEAALHRTESGKCGYDRLNIRAVFKCNGGCCNCIEHIVLSGNMKRDPSESFPAVHKVEGSAAESIIMHIRRVIIRRIGEVKSVCCFSAAEFVQQLPHMRIVGAADKQTVGGHSCNKFAERIDNVIHCLEIVKMIVVDIVDKHNRWMQRQKAFNVFTCFGNKKVMGTQANAAVQEINHAADMNGRIKSAVFGNECKHGGNCGFAVAAGNSDDFAIASADNAESNGTLDFRNAEFACADAFRVVGFYCG